MDAALYSLDCYNQIGSKWSDLFSFVFGYMEKWKSEGKKWLIHSSKYMQDNHYIYCVINISYNNNFVFNHVSIKKNIKITEENINSQTKLLSCML